METILRNKVQEAIDSGTFKSLNALARKAGVDPAGLSRFMKNEGVGESKTTFSFASKLISALGGRIEFGVPGEQEKKEPQICPPTISREAWEEACADAARYRRERIDRLEADIRNIQAMIIQLLDKKGKASSE